MRTSIVKDTEVEITNTAGKKVKVRFSGETNAKGQPHGEGSYATEDGIRSQGLHREGERYGFSK